MLNKKALAATSGVSQYQIERSLRFNSADSAYLGRTPASAGNRRTWTISLWLKRCKLGTLQSFTSSANDTLLLFDANDKLNFYQGGYVRTSAQVFRDVSAWYHIVLAVDTTNATAQNRARLYVNGSEITNWSTNTTITQNTDTNWNAALAHQINANDTAQFGDLYIADFYSIDGQQLTPSSFGETDADTGIWKPKAFSGTYGTNGFYLDFSDNSGTTSTTLGKDYSGNSNNFTPNNFSVTAGAGNDSLVDTPTPYGTDTGAGGEVRGNYCTLNPLDNGGLTLSNGNLQFDRATASWISARSTVGMSSGKWYWEVVQTTGTSMMVGISKNDASQTSYVGAAATGWAYNSGDGNKYNNSSNSSYGNTYTTNDVIGVAFDADSGDLKFYKNGTVQNSGTAAYTGLTSGPYFPAVSLYGTATAFINFGQRPFAYTAPSGFKALCTTNLPTPTIGATATTRADDYFNTVLYTGTGATRSITGVGFAPDFVWNKGRSNAVDHCLNDIVRGANKQLVSNTTDAELTYTNQLTSFDSDGFSLGADNLGYTNYNNVTYVAWNWKANGAGVSNTQGTITSTVSANTTSGFSIVTYTGNGTSNSSVGHGLGATPVVAIIKSRSQSGENWHSYWSVLGQTKDLQLNTTDAAFTYTSPNIWGSTSWSSTLFYLGSQTGINSNGSTYVAYCFAPVAGFSAFGSYTGNGSTDGPFIYTGFRPAFIIVKQTNTGGENWYLMDNKRSTFNLVNDTLYPNQSSAETVDNANVTCDFTSNGFKIRDSYTGWNANGGTYIYACFAENPFKYSLAR